MHALSPKFCPLHSSSPEVPSPELQVPCEPQTSPRSRRPFPITSEKGEGAAHTEFTKRATKNEVRTSWGTDSLLQHPSYHVFPLQRDQTARIASGSIHRHPAQPSAPWVMAATRSARSNHSPETATCFYKIVRGKKKYIYI